MRRSTRILKREIKKHKIENEEKEKQEKLKKEQKDREREELELLSLQPRKKQKITEDKHKTNYSSNGGDTDEEDNTFDEVTLGKKESLLLSTLSATTNLFERLNSIQKKDFSSKLTRALSDATMELPPIDLCQLAIPSFFDGSQRTFFPLDEENEDIDENITQFNDFPIEIIVDIFLYSDSTSRICLAQTNSFYYTIFQKWVGYDTILIRKPYSRDVVVKKSEIRKTLSEGKDLSDYQRDAVLKLVFDTAFRCEKLLSFNWNRPYRGPHSFNAKLYPQPSLINIPLYSHQLQALHWMMNVEKLVREGRKCEFSVLTKVEGFLFGVETWRVDRSYFNDLDREIILNPEEMVDDDEFKDSFTIKGGIFADEMGLGKTLTILSLILSNPTVPFDHSKIKEKVEDNAVKEDSIDIKKDEGDTVDAEEFKIIEDEEIFKLIVDEKDSEEEEKEEEKMDEDDDEWDAKKINKRKSSRSKSPRKRRTSSSKSPSKSPKNSQRKSKKKVDTNDDGDDNMQEYKEEKEEGKNKLAVARKSRRSRSPFSSSSAPSDKGKKEENNEDNIIESKEGNKQDKDQNGTNKRKLPTARKSHRSPSPKKVEKKKTKEEEEDEESKSPKKYRKRGRSAIKSSDNVNKLDEVWIDEGDGKKRRRKLFTSKGTLILCPNHIIEQWSTEFNKRSKYPLKIITIRLMQHLHAQSYRSLVEADIVILSPTFLFSNPSYLKLCSNDYQVKNKTFLTPPLDQTPLIHHIHWHRIVLDEGHEVQAERDQWLTYHSTYRWYVSGTPIPLGRCSMVTALDYLHFTILPPPKSEVEDQIHTPHHNNEKVKLANQKESNDIIEEEIGASNNGDNEDNDEEKVKKEKKEIEEVDLKLLQLQREYQRGSLPYEIVLFQALKKLFYWRNTKNSILQFQTDNKRSEVILTKVKEELRIVRLTDLEKLLLKIDSTIAFPLRNLIVKEALTGSERNLNNPSFVPSFLTYYLSLVKKEEMYEKRLEIVKAKVEEDLTIVSEFCDKLPEKMEYKRSFEYYTWDNLRKLKNDLQVFMKKTHSDEKLLEYLSTAAPFRSLMDNELQVEDVVDNNLKMEDADEHTYCMDIYDDDDEKDLLFMFVDHFRRPQVDPKHREIKNRLINCYALTKAQERDALHQSDLKKLKEEKEVAWKKQSKKEMSALSNRPQPAKYTKKLIDEYAKIGYKRVYGRCGTKMAEIAHYIYIQLFYSIYLSKEESGMEFDHAKILVFAKNVKGLRNLEIALHIFDPAYFDSTKVSTITGSSLTTDKAVREFQKSNGEGIRVLLFPQRNYASGTDLHNTTHVLLIESREYASKEEAQAYDGQAIARAHRIGQKNDVSVVRFLVENTYEQLYYEDVYGPIVLPSPDATTLILS